MFSTAVELQVRPTFSGGKRVLSACRAFTFLTNNRMTKVFKMNTEITPALVREFFNYDPNTGVSWNKAREMWAATMSVSGKTRVLGLSKNFFEAVCLRKSAENAHGFHQNHGRHGAYV